MYLNPVVLQQVCDCKGGVLWVQYPFKDMKYLFKFILSFLQSGAKTKHAMAPESMEKWGTEGLNSRFLLSTLLCLVLCMQQADFT